MDRETKRANLMRFMRENGYKASTLAAALGVTRYTIYKYLAEHGSVVDERTIGHSFCWRFGARFGWELACELFGEEEEKKADEREVPEYA